MAALKVHVGVSLLTHRCLDERSGGKEEIGNLRRKVKGLRIDKERLEKELEEASLVRKEMEQMRRKNGDLRRKVRGLEDELLEVKGRLIADTDGRSGGAGGMVGHPPWPVRLLPRCACLFPPGQGGRGRSLLNTGAALRLPFPGGGGGGRAQYEPTPRPADR